MGKTIAGKQRHKPMRLQGSTSSTKENGLRRTLSPQLYSTSDDQRWFWRFLLPCLVANLRLCPCFAPGSSKSEFVKSSPFHLMWSIALWYGLWSLCGKTWHWSHYCPFHSGQVKPSKSLRPRRLAKRSFGKWPVVWHWCISMLWVYCVG
jgi:hypothetical protein